MKAYFVLLLLLLPFAALSAEPRIVAIGDIHGDFQSFKNILEASGIVNPNGDWSGQDSILVQTGDVLDRGPKGKQVLDLLMKLERQASEAGGRVYALLGNHEVMNIMNDLRYVTEEEFANFSDKQSEKRRKNAYNEYKKLQKARANSRKQQEPSFTPEMEETWMKAHPVGYFEYVEAFAPKGLYGKWLRKRSAVVELQENIFVHGGISPKIASMKLSEINDRIHQELELFDRLKQQMIDQKVILPFFTFDEMIDAAKRELEIRKNDSTLENFLGLSGWLCIYPDGPLWFRGYAQWSDEELAAQLPALLQAYKVQRIVVGHTVMKNGTIQSRQNHGVLMIDTGLNAAVYKGGRSSALEIKDGNLIAFYDGSKIPITP
jgi:hypothetical protein